MKSLQHLSELICGNGMNFHQINGGSCKCKLCKLEFSNRPRSKLLPTPWLVRLTSLKENVALLFRRTACLVIATTFQLLNAVLGRLVEASSAISNLDYISNFHQFPTTLRHL